MTPAEYRASMEGVADPTWWKTKVTEINLSHHDFNQKFTGIISAYEFIYEHAKNGTS